MNTQNGIPVNGGPKLIIASPPPPPPTPMHSREVDRQSRTGLIFWYYDDEADDDGWTDGRTNEHKVLVLVNDVLVPVLMPLVVVDSTAVLLLVLRWCAGELPAADVVVCQLHVIVVTVPRGAEGSWEVSFTAECSTQTVGCRQTYSWRGSFIIIFLHVCGFRATMNNFLQITFCKLSAAGSERVIFSPTLVKVSPLLYEKNWEMVQIIVKCKCQILQR